MKATARLAKSPELIKEHTKQALSTFFQTLEALRGTDGGLLDSTKVLPSPLKRDQDISKMLDLFPSEGAITGTGTGTGTGGTNSRGILELVQRVYPFHLFGLDSAQAASVVSVVGNLSITMLPPQTQTQSPVETEKNSTNVMSEGESSTQLGSPQTYQFLSVRASPNSGDGHECAELVFQHTVSGIRKPDVIVTAQCGPTLTPSTSTNPLQDISNQTLVSHFHPNGTQSSLLTSMMQAHAAGYDVCVVGSKGSGKSLLTEQFAHHLGYAQPELICCYKDMTSRDLLQRRR